MMKRIVIGVVAVMLLSALLWSCGSKEQAGAERMIAVADSLYQQGQYDEALAWLDSLAVIYPREVEPRKRALAMTREIRLERSRRDSVDFAQRQMELTRYTDSLYQHFTLVTAPGMPDENVIRYKGYNPSVADAAAPFVDAYVANDGTLELIASASAGSPLGLTFVKLTQSVGKAYEVAYVVSDTLQYDGGLNYRFENLGRHYERLTFTGERAMPLGAFVANAAPEVRLTVELCNERRGRVMSFALSKSAREAIAESYHYAKGLQEMMALQAELQKHDRRLLNERERQLKEGVGNLE